MNKNIQKYISKTLKNKTIYLQDINNIASNSLDEVKHFVNEAVKF